MSSMIPYTQAAFNKIANNSHRMHNNQFVGGPPVNNDVGATFNFSFIGELDLYIQSILYDVDIRIKTKNYVDHLMKKWGQHVNKSIMGSIQDLDMKYVSVFKERGFLVDLFAPYVYDNVLINE